MVSDASYTIGNTLPALRANRVLSEMSPRKKALAPVVTLEQLMASLEDLDAELNQRAGRHTPPTPHHPASPGLSPFHLLPLLDHHEPPWDEYGGSAESGLDLGRAGSTSDEPHSIAGNSAPWAQVKPPGALAREVFLPLESEQKRRKRTYREHL